MRLSIAAIAFFAVTTLVPGVVRADDSSAAATDAVEAFHEALATGNREAALERLAPSVVVFEGGHAQNSRDEYDAHHLGADMTFSQAVERSVVDRAVRKPSDDVRIVLSTTRTTGTFREKEIEITGKETMVLTRNGDGWKITHIHWSSSRGH